MWQLLLVHGARRGKRGWRRGNEGSDCRWHERGHLGVFGASDKLEHLGEHVPRERRLLLLQVVES